MKQDKNNTKKTDEERFRLVLALKCLMDDIHDGPLFIKCENTIEFWTLYCLLDGVAQEGKEIGKSLTMAVDQYLHNGLFINSYRVMYQGGNANHFVDKRAFPFSRFVKELRKIKIENEEPKKQKEDRAIMRSLLKKAKEDCLRNYQEEINDYTSYVHIASEEEIPLIKAFIKERGYECPFALEKGDRLAIGHKERTVRFGCSLVISYAVKNGAKWFNNVKEFLISEEAFVNASSPAL